MEKDEIKYSINKSISENNLLLFNYCVSEYGKDIITEDDFIYACNLGHLDIIEYMFEINPDLNFEYADQLGFKIACKKGYYDIVNFLIYIYSNNKNNLIKDEEPFLIACDNGDIKLLNILIKKNFNIKDYYYLNYNIKITEHCFINSCSRGNLNLAKWLYEYDPEINISKCDEKAFEKACYSGNINIIGWLLDIKPNINIRINNDEIFIMTTNLGELIVSDFLLNYCKDLFNLNNVNIILDYACNNGKYDNILWILNKNIIKKFDLDYNKYCDKCIENNYNKEFILFISCFEFNDKKIDPYYLFMKACLYGNDVIGQYLLNNYDIVYEKIDDMFYENILNSKEKVIMYNKNKDGYEKMKNLILKLKPSISSKKCFFCI